MERKRCATCRFWSQEEIASGRRDQNVGACTLADSEDGEPKHLESIAFAEDGESVKAWLITGASFYCNQYQPTDAERQRAPEPREERPFTGVQFGRQEDDRGRR